jgi:hypothetical protein
MKPIAATKLPHVVTLYNVIKPDDGGASLVYKTILENVRVGTYKTRVAVANVGATAKYNVEVLVDPKTTKGYGYAGEPRERIDKKYLYYLDWEGLPEEDKPNYWTLRPLDWLYATVGAKSSIGPGYIEGTNEQRFRLDNHIKVINEAAPIIDKDGSIHHWKVYFD